MKLVKRLVKREPPAVPTPCLFTEEERQAFFYRLQQLSLEEQVLAIQAEMKRNVGITGTKEFVRWGVAFAEVLRDYDIVWDDA